MTRIDGALISAVKYFRPKSEHTEDHPLSSVHYKLAFGVILACAILTGLTSWFSPIECTKPSGTEFEMPYVKQICYAYSTYVIEGPYAKDGIFNGIINSYSDSENHWVYVNYYRWVTLCLLIQAASFQIPHILWKALEGGRTRRLIEQFKGLEAASDALRAERIAFLAHRLRTRQQTESVFYFRAFVVCQSLYFLNVIVQILLTQGFLNGNFISLVPKWLSNQPVLDIVFPKAVKCDLKSYGTSGSKQMQNVMCTLAMNVLNEKIYLLLWGIFMIALITSIVQLIYVGMMSFSSGLRNSSLEIDEHRKSSCERSTRPISHGEWLLLKFVKDNLDDTKLFEDFLGHVINRSSKNGTIEA